MNIEQLTSLGGVIPAAPVKTSITWERQGPDGETLSDTFDVFVRRLAYADQERILKMAGFYEQMLRAQDGEEDVDLPDDDHSLNSATIAVALRLGEDGEERLSYEQACRLDASLAREFILAINKVNPTPPAKKKG